MNEKISEQIFDSFVEEIVNQPTPPDLVARIEAAWQREQGGSLAPPVLSPAQLVSTSTAAKKSVVDASPLVLAIPIEPPPRPRAFRRNSIAISLALGACGLLSLLSWQLIVQNEAVRQMVAVDSPPASPKSAVGGGSQPGLASAATSPEQAADKQTPPSLTINIDDLPFALDGSADPTSATTGPASRSGDRVSGPFDAVALLDGRAITQQIDQRLRRVWQTLEIVPTERLSPVELAQQISLQLTAQPLPPGSSLDPSQLVAEASQSLPFARVWADRFVELWFDRGNIALDAPQIEALKSRVAAYIHGNQPWNILPRELLGGDIAAATASGGPAELAADRASAGPTARPAADPIAASTLAFVSAFAGNGNHRLVSRIGTSFLDTNLACVRCHEANLAGSSEQVVLTPTERQSVYWSLVAMLQGIDSQAVTGRGLVAIDRQTEQLASGKPLTAYYDLLDGRLQAAEPSLPDGRAWQSVSNATAPRAALAEWLSQSTALDAATVNQVWKMVFGSPLVPLVEWQLEEASANLAITERRALQLFLAGQYRAHQHDLKQLIGWIVRSDAFSRKPLELSRPQWLNASDQELRQWQLVESCFAAGPRPTAPVANLEDALLAMLKWKSTSDSDRTNLQGTTLAQPAPREAATGNSGGQPAHAPADPSPLSLAYSRYAALPSREDVLLVERLLATPRLSWEDRVEHVVILNANNLASGRVKHLADELLRQHSGDARGALLDLCWAVKSSDSL